MLDRTELVRLSIDDLMKRALELGADVLELDLHATSDGVVVLMHDDAVDRTTDGSGPVRAQTLRQIKALDAAAHFSDALGGRAHRARPIGFA